MMDCLHIKKGMNFFFLKQTICEFLIKQNLFQYNPSGVFIHVPKCAGTTAQAILKNADIDFIAKIKGTEDILLYLKLLE